jgi:hypothetical protein
VKTPCICSLQGTHSSESKQVYVQVYPSFIVDGYRSIAAPGRALRFPLPRLHDSATTLPDRRALLLSAMRAASLSGGGVSHVSTSAEFLFQYRQQRFRMHGFPEHAVENKDLIVGIVNAEGTPVNITVPYTAMLAPVAANRAELQATSCIGRTRGGGSGRPSDSKCAMISSTTVHRSRYTSSGSSP